MTTTACPTTTRTETGSTTARVPLEHPGSVLATVLNAYSLPAREQ